MNSKSNIKKQPSRSPTLEDVARAVGLSPMTVSRAINTPDIVRPKTVAKVMEAVRATGYIPNMLAGSLASRRSKLIAVVVPQINNNMFVDTVQAISDELAIRGYHMLLCVAGYNHETENDIVSTILSRRPDGIVLTGIHHSTELKKSILNSEIPVVEIWDLTPTPIDMLVGFSHEKIGHAIGEYLFNKGHTRFGLIWTDDKRAMLRQKGLQDELRRHKKTIVHAVSVPLPATMARGREGLAALLDDGKTLDAIVCSSDTLAQGAIFEAQKRGLSVPGNLAVMGFGDLDFADCNIPSITTVKIDRWKIGKDAANMLADKIEGKPVDEAVADIGFSLIERESA
ncbi:MAG TPA: LacI family DNA-binding transcriptional regulator [Buttiauxella sp.]|uniref:LacI family DNA-binding transcriptional regulator n=1 Tax=Buttiauxella sp. TaxID=1972222 RepID=UPI002B474396|nr:LacI family DNA-binding transcriptional regulator [Buttiauxella sp.]HKM97673.1 LacI family DNA-binding transcriptional regulator [Buttiauxella sp.]